MLWTQEAAKVYQASVEIQSDVVAAALSSEVPSQSQVDFTRDPSPPHERGTKRTAEDDLPSESHKKAKFGIITSAPLVRKILTSLLEQKGPPPKRFVDFFISSDSTCIMD